MQQLRCVIFHMAMSPDPGKLSEGQKGAMGLQLRSTVILAICHELEHFMNLCWTSSGLEHIVNEYLFFE